VGEAGASRGNDMLASIIADLERVAGKGGAE
jgi:hypothetical protein